MSTQFTFFIVTDDSRHAGASRTPGCRSDWILDIGYSILEKQIGIQGRIRGSAGFLTQSLTN
jgi:hypothetical protein